MNNKVLAILEIVAALAVIYIGKQLLAEGRSNLLS